MRFAPDNTNNLDAMFQAMNSCQALHPDPQDSFSDGKIILFKINIKMIKKSKFYFIFYS